MPDEIPIERFEVIQDEEGIRIEAIVPSIYLDALFAESLRASSFGFDLHREHPPRPWYRELRLWWLMWEPRWRVAAAWRVLRHGDPDCDY